MKHIPLFTILILIISCSKEPTRVVFTYTPKDIIVKDTAVIKDKIEQCVSGEFFLKGIVNDKCWVTEKIETTLLNGIFGLNSSLDSNFIQHKIAIQMGSNLELGKINSLVRYNSGRDKRFIAYNYCDYDAGIGYFGNTSVPDSIHNYFIIDKINSDTSIVEARFEAIIQELRITSITNYQIQYS